MGEIINKIIIVASSSLFILLCLHSDVAWKGAVQGVAKKGINNFIILLRFVLQKDKNKEKRCSLAT